MKSDWVLSLDNRGEERRGDGPGDIIVITIQSWADFLCKIKWQQKREISLQYSEMHDSPLALVAG